MGSPSQSRDIYGDDGGDMVEVGMDEETEIMMVPVTTGNEDDIFKEQDDDDASFNKDKAGSSASLDEELQEVMLVAAKTEKVLINNMNADEEISSSVADSNDAVTVPLNGE